MSPATLEVPYQDQTWGGSPASNTLRSEDSLWGETYPAYGDGWWLHVRDTLRRFIAYPRDWDSYGSPPIQRRAVEEATIALLVYRVLFHGAALFPHIAPVSGGGIQLDFDTQNRGLELGIFPDGRFEYLLVEGNELIEEGEFEGRFRLPALFQWLHQR